MEHSIHTRFVAAQTGDIANKNSKYGGSSMLKAREIMTDDIVSIRPEASIHEAIEILLSKEISGLPVIDEKGQLIGVITEFALLATVYDNRLQQHVVAQHMTTDVLSVDADAPIADVVDLCILHRVRRVPVTKNNQVVGLIARRDVLKAMYEAQAPVCTS